MSPAVFSAADRRIPASRSPVRRRRVFSGRGVIGVRGAGVIGVVGAGIVGVVGPGIVGVVYARVLVGVVGAGVVGIVGAGVVRVGVVALLRRSERFLLSLSLSLV